MRAVGRFTIAAALVLPVAAGAQQVTQRDAAIVGQKYVGAPGGTAPTDASRPGIDAVLEGTSGDADVSIRVGTKWRNTMLDAALSSGKKDGEPLTSVAEGGKDPLSGSGALTVGATWVKWEPEIDAFSMLALCNGITPCATNNEKLPAPVRSQLLNHIDLKSAKTFGFKAKLTRPEFKYRSDAAAEDTTVRHSGSEVTVGAGMLWPTVFYAGISAGYERTWEGAADPVNICTDIDDLPTASECAETVLGLPVRKSGPLVAATLRMFTPHFVVAPRFEHHEATRKTVFELPIYFVPDSETAALTGGAAFRLTNGKARIFVFVGTRIPSFGLPK